MKKILSFLIIITICLVFQGQKVPEKQTNISQSNLVLFAWYHDPDYFDPTGTVCTTADEIDRLRTTFPSYIFKDSPGFGLLPIEWGYFSPSVTAVIYSNL